MLESEEAKLILAGEQRSMQKRLRVGIPVLLIVLFLGWARISRRSGDAATNALIVAIMAVVAIGVLFWLNRRWLTRVRRGLRTGEVVQVQGEVEAAHTTQLRLAKQKFHVARILLSDARLLKKGDRIELDYLPGMRLAIRLRKL